LSHPRSRRRAVAAAHFPSLKWRVARAGAVGRRPVAVWMPASLDHRLVAPVTPPPAQNVRADNRRYVSMPGPSVAGLAPAHVLLVEPVLVRHRRRWWRRRRSRTGHLLVVGGLRGVRSGSQATEAAVRPAGVAQPGRARSWICPGQTRAGRGARRTADRLVRRWRTTPPTRAQGASKARRPGRSGSCSASRSGRERRRCRTWAGSHQACS